MDGMQTQAGIMARDRQAWPQILRTRCFAKWTDTTYDLNATIDTLLAPPRP